MTTIRVLPQAVADRIAAGEVVERPASVLRELLDNAVDAGATRAEVEIGGGGRELISVADDGRGLVRDDAVLAFERHATSKISEGSDLERIATLGFRGEALAAIAAVSRVEMITRAAGEDAATRVLIDQGRLLRVEPAARGPGTTVSVRALFSGIPARRKFLKKPQTELDHVLKTATRLALARPAVGVRLRQGERELLGVPAGDDLERRVRSLLEPRSRPGALVAVERSAPPYRLRAWISPADVHRYNRDGMQIFVGGRPVRDPLLLRAVADAYRGRLPQGRHPIVAVYLDLPPEDVDVNVHPAKSEVRFHRPREVRALVVGALSAALGTREAIPSFTSAPSPRRDLGWEAPATAPTPDPAGPTPDQASLATVAAGAGDAGSGSSEGWPSDEGSVRALAQYRETYIIAEDAQGLLVVDQHVAHERMNYEALSTQAEEGGIPRQGLIFPRPLELEPRQAEIAKEHAATLERLGFGLEGFGGTSVLVREVPAVYGRRARPEALVPLLETLERGDLAGARDLFDHLIATIACHASVRKGDGLDLARMNYLLRGLDRCESPSHCPHGRAISLRIDLSRLDRSFDR